MIVIKILKMFKLFCGNKNARAKKCSTKQNHYITKVDGPSFKGSPNLNNLKSGTLQKLCLEEKLKYETLQQQKVASDILHTDPSQVVEVPERKKIVDNKKMLQQFESNLVENDVTYRSPSLGDLLLSNSNGDTTFNTGFVGIKNTGVAINRTDPTTGDNIEERVSEQVMSRCRLIVPQCLNIASIDCSGPLVGVQHLYDTTKIERYLIETNWPQIFHKNQLSKNLFQNDCSNKISSNLSNAPESHSLPLTSFEPAPTIRQTEKIVVDLKKDINGIGLIIPNYEKLSGVRIKMIRKGSAADSSGKINENDLIVEVDGRSIKDYTNLEVIKKLRNCGSVVKLGLERLSYGSKCPQQQKDINDMNSSTPRPSASDMTRYSTEDGNLLLTAKTKDGNTNTSEKPIVFDEDRIRSKWRKLLEPDLEIIIAKMTIIDRKSGLGVNLKGTIGVENGKEVRRQYYIKSILSEGNVAKNGILKLGDELLEISGYKVSDMKFSEISTFLKNLPINVCIVCGRRKVNVFHKYLRIQ